MKRPNYFAIVSLFTMEDNYHHNCKCHSQLAIGITENIGAMLGYTENAATDNYAHTFYIYPSY